MVTCGFYQTLGVRPAIGRLFLQEECLDKGPKAALISHRLWERRFNSDRSLVGRAVTINNEPVTVIGVMPASFDFGSVFAPGTRADIWTPFPIDQTHDQWGNTLSLVGRLKPGVTVESAQTEMNALTRAAASRTARTAARTGDRGSRRCRRTSADVSARRCSCCSRRSARSC